MNLQEAKKILSEVIVDIHNLTKACNGMRDFIQANRGTAQVKLKDDVIKWENMLKITHDLKGRIHEAIIELEYERKLNLEAKYNLHPHTGCPDITERL